MAERTITPSVRTERGPTQSLSRVVSTYVRPAERSRQTESLLSSLGFAATAALDKREELQKEQDHATGVALGLAQSAAEDPQKIRNGEMLAQKSEAFVAGYMESYGKKFAFDKLRQWSTEYENWEGKNSNDPQAFTGWMDEKLKEAISSVGQDKFAIAGAMPVLQMGLQQFSQKHASYTSERMKTEQLDNMAKIVQGEYENFDWEQDGALGKFADMVKHEADLRVNMGLHGKEVNTRLVNSIVSLADGYNDTKPLEALAAAHDAGTYRLNPEQIALVEQATQQIDSELEQLADQRWRASERARIVRTRRVLDDAWDNLSKDPEWEPDWSQLSAEESKAVMDMRGTLFRNMASQTPQEAQLDALEFVRHIDENVMDLPVHERGGAIRSYLENNPDVVVGDDVVRQQYHRAVKTDDPESVINHAYISPLRKNAVSAIKTLAPEYAEAGDSAGSDLATAYRAALDTMLLSIDKSQLTDSKAAKAVFQELSEAAFSQALNQSTGGQFDILMNDLTAGAANSAALRTAGLWDTLEQHHQALEKARAAKKAASDEEMNAAREAMAEANAAGESGESEPQVVIEEPPETDRKPLSDRQRQNLDALLGRATLPDDERRKTLEALDSIQDPELRDLLKRRVDPLYDVE